MSGIHGLCWFPAVPDKFVTWGTEVTLYRVAPNEDKAVFSSGFNKELSPNSSALLLATEDRYQYIRCLKPSFNEDVVVAVGLASGGVSICNFNQNNESLVEFVPRQQRPCVCLAWNEVEKNLLAIGQDRNRSDYCIFVWDTERGAPKESITMIGLNETTHSLCWDKTYKVLAAGMNQKNIKLFDLRQGSSSTCNVTTRMIHGLCISPNNRYLSSYADTVIGLWDVRNLEKPLSQIQTAKNITNLSWCPTRSTVLSTIQRDSPFVQLVDVHCAENENSFDIFCTKRFVAPPHQSKGYNTHKTPSAVDMSWHSSDFERILILSENGSITDFNIPEPAAVAWDTKNNLWKIAGVHGPNNIADSINECFKEDIAQTMYKRAINDYGLLPDIKKNGDLSQNNNLKVLWTLLANMTRDDKILGMKDVLGISNTDVLQASRSETQVVSWPDSINSSHPLVSYKSESRDFAQGLCGWNFEADAETFCNKFIPELCLKKEFSRAAMICTFHLKIKQAIDILSKAADQSSDTSVLRMAAIALSGFNADRCNAALRNQRGHLQIQDPHLKAMFGFLTTENENFESVLMEKGVSLADRMAFACKYLSDSKLADYTKSIIQSSIKSADVHGLLLTGESAESISLLQSYLDNTDDVQTVSLITIRFFRHEVFSEYRVQYWISSYLDLLDTWGLWEKRSELEIKMENIRTPPKPIRSVFLLCNFCGKSVSAALQDESRMRNATSNSNKLSSCPNCRKPLPRCSLCLLHMGTSTSTFVQSGAGHDAVGWQSKPFSKWFSWCQTCRHGGHTEHLMQWFSQHFECPVTACSCKCFTMDLTIAEMSRDSS